MKLAFVGDIALFGSYSLLNKNIKDRLHNISEYLSAFDYVVGNLESPFSSKKKPYGAKSAYVFSEIENIEILKMLHINCVTLANNHMFDFGEEGYNTTVELLDKSNISHFGHGGKTVELIKDNNKIKFFGFCCYSSNPLSVNEQQGGQGINKYNVKDTIDLIIDAKNDGFLPVVSVHAGLEHVNYPSIEHVEAARLIANNCQFIYYGHHPHVVQGIEMYKGSLIAHSLGNFCFDDIYLNSTDNIPFVKLTENNRIGAILDITIENNLIKDWKFQPIHIANDGQIDIIESFIDLSEYNTALKSCSTNRNIYNKKRQNIIMSRTNERKSQRNFFWYIKRLRPRYFRLFFDMKINLKKFHNNVIRYIQK